MSENGAITEILRKKKKEKMQEEQTTIPLYYGTDVRTTARPGLLQPLHPGYRR